MIAGTWKHRALTSARYGRREFQTHGDINVMRLINRTEPGVNLDACVWGDGHRVIHIWDVPLTGRFKMSLRATNATISYVLDIGPVILG